MPLPQPIIDFLLARMVPNVLCLPQNYAIADAFADFQDGCRHNAKTGQPLTSQRDGDFKPSWYVLCTNEWQEAVAELEEQNEA